MQELSAEAVRSIFFVLEPSVLAAVLNSSNNCRRKLAKATITSKQLSTDLQRKMAYSKLRQVLETDLNEALYRAWEEQFRETIDTVQRLAAENDASLHAFVLTRPVNVRNVLVCLGMVPANLAEGYPKVLPSSDETMDAGGSEKSPDSLTREVRLLNKELSSIRRKLKIQEGRHGKERQKANYELQTCRQRLGDTRRELSATKDELINTRTVCNKQASQLNQMGGEIANLKLEVERLTLELSAALLSTREAQSRAEIAEKEKRQALISLKELEDNKSRVLLTPEIVKLLFAAPDDSEVEQLTYSRDKALRDVKRALTDATEEGDLPDVWAKMLGEEQEIISQVSNVDDSSSEQDAIRHLDLLVNLEYQLHVRLTLVQRLRLAVSRLIVHYEANRSNDDGT